MQNTFQGDQDGRNKKHSTYNKNKKKTFDAQRYWDTRRHKRTTVCAIGALWVKNV